MSSIPLYIKPNSESRECCFWCYHVKLVFHYFCLASPSNPSKSFYRKIIHRIYQQLSKHFLSSPYLQNYFRFRWTTTQFCLLLRARVIKHATQLNNLLLPKLLHFDLLQKYILKWLSVDSKVLNYFKSNCYMLQPIKNLMCVGQILLSSENVHLRHPLRSFSFYWLKSDCWFFRLHRWTRIFTL